MLDKIDNGLKMSIARNQKKKFMKFFIQLVAIKDDLEDEEMLARAKKLWVLHRPQAKEWDTA